MRSLIALLEGWAKTGHAAQRAAVWLLFWPLLLVLRLPASLQRGSDLQGLSISDWVRGQGRVKSGFLIFSHAPERPET